MSDGDLTPRPLTVHKQRQYNTITRTHRYNHENGRIGSSASGPRNAEEHRGTSSSNTVPTQVARISSESANTLRTQPSLKHRLLNRIASGLHSKVQVNGLNGAVGDTQRTTSTPPLTRDAAHTGSRGSSSDTYSPTDLDKTLAAFPTPPTSHTGTPKTDQSSNSVRSLARVSQDLCVPRRHAALAAEIRTIVCQGHQLPNQSTLVGVEISTTTNDPFTHPDLPSAHNAVDVVVVIDNS